MSFPYRPHRPRTPLPPHAGRRARSEPGFGRPFATPGPDEVVVRIEAAPINPSDLGLLFGAADMATAAVSGTAAPPRW